MLAHRYHIFKSAWGPTIGSQAGNEKRLVGINAVAKRSSNHEFEVFNELVAGRLGQYMGLPIPAGMVIEKAGELYFASCHVSAANGELPEARLDLLCKNEASLACGVMVFDAWIANDDRHSENIWYDYYTNEVFVFDQGNSLLCDVGDGHLYSNDNCLGVRYALDALSEYITSFSAFGFWYEAVLRIPDAAIAHLTSEAVAVGVDQDLASKVCEWLLNRRKELPRLFRQEIDRFPQLKASIVDPFSGYCDDPPPEYSI